MQFEQYSKLVYNKVWNIVNKYHLNSDIVKDLLSDGIAIYYDCVEKYDKSKANFSTFLYTQLNRLETQMKRTSLKYSELLDFDFDTVAVIDNYLSFSDFIELSNLNRDSKKLFYYVLQKWDYDLTKGEIKKYFTKEHKWTIKRFEFVWQKCKEFIKEF